MADPRTFELDELVNRPGMYFNPQTDVVMIVDDTVDVDTEIFNMEEIEGADWVLIADEAPVDEARRDALIERFQVTQRPAADFDEDRRHRPLPDLRLEAGRHEEALLRGPLSGRFELPAGGDQHRVVLERLVDRAAQRQRRTLVHRARRAVQMIRRLSQRDAVHDDQDSPATYNPFTVLKDLKPKK